MILAFVVCFNVERAVADVGQKERVSASAISEQASLDNGIVALAGRRDSLTYILGPDDRLRVTVHDRKDLTGEYRVRSNGTVSIPLLGNFRLDDKDVSDLEREIMDRLPGAFVAVEVIERRPFYVLGRVAQPGAYPFVPGMTVLHAIAYAGGLQRLDDNAASLSMSMLSQVANRNNIRQEAIADILKYDLLIAERAGANVIAPSKELVSLVGEGRADILAAEATNLLRHRTDVRLQRRSALQQQVHLAVEEVAAFEKQLTGVQEHQSLASEGLRRLKRLLERNLTSTSRVFDMQRFVAQAREGDQRVQAEIARAKRVKARAEADLVAVDVEHRQEVDGELQQLKTRIRSNLETLRALEGVLEQMPIELLQTAQGPNAKLDGNEANISITRKRGDGHVILKARSTTQMQPGDLVQVK